MPDWSDGCFDPGCARSANPGAQCNCNDFFNARGTRGNNLCSPLQMLSRDGVPVETAEAIYASIKADSESVMRGLRCISKAQNIWDKMTQQLLADAIRLSAVFPLIQSLDLSCCHITDKNIEDLCMWISKGGCPQLKALNLSGMEVGRSGCKILSSFLGHDPAFCNLESLNVGFGKAHGCAAIIYAIKEERGWVMRKQWCQRLQRTLRKILGFRNNVNPIQTSTPNVLPRLKSLVYTIDSYDTLELARQIRLGSLPSLVEVHTLWSFTLDRSLYLASQKLQQSIEARRICNDVMLESISHKEGLIYGNST